MCSNLNLTLHSFNSTLIMIYSFESSNTGKFPKSCGCHIPSPSVQDSTMCNFNKPHSFIRDLFAAADS